MMRSKKVILVIIDTLRADHLSCYGYRRETTPNIDNLAKDGILFKHAFSPCSYTLPAITSILTSKHPSGHSICFNQTDGQLNTDVDITLQEMLSGSGYSTAAFVSTIVLRRETNLNAGFELYDDELNSSELNRPSILMRDGQETVEKAIQWIEKNRERDFFALIHCMDVHGPYNCHAPYDHMFVDDGMDGPMQTLDIVPDDHPYCGIPAYQALCVKRDDAGNIIGYADDARYYKARYDGCIRRCDTILSKLFERLKTLGIYDDTMIILTADHGESLGEHNVYFYHGLTVTPDQISVPLIIKPHSDWNLTSRVITHHVSTLDLMPTILSACSINDSGLGLHGNSLLPLIEGRVDTAMAQRVIFCETERQKAFIRQDNTIELSKKEPVDSSYYSYIQVLIDYLDGRKYSIDLDCNKLEHKQDNLIYVNRSQAKDYSALVADYRRKSVELEQKSAELMQKSAELEQKSTELDSINQSVTWRLIKTYQQLVDRLCPPGTRRSRAYVQSILALRRLTIRK